MKSNKMAPGVRVGAAAGGALLLAAPFLPWAEAHGSSQSGWDVASAVCVLASITGFVAIASAATGGRIGLFRPDVSLYGAADLLGVVSTVVIAWLIFDLPAGLSPDWGIFAALIGAFAVMSVCGDYRSLRGAPLFPRLDAGDERPRG